MKNKYAMAIFLDYANGQDIKENIQYPQFFIEELKIYNLKRYHERLCNNGYLKKEGKTTHITTKGEEFLEENKSLIDFFWEASTSITLNEFLAVISAENCGYKLSKEKYYSILISILRDKIKSLQKDCENNYMLLINAIKEIIGYYIKIEDKNNSYVYSILLLYYQTSGAFYYNDIVACINKERKFKSLQNTYSNTYIDHEIIANIRTLKEDFDEELVKGIYAKARVFSRINLYSADEFYNLAKLISEGKFRNEEFLRGFKEKYKSIVKKAKQY